MLYKLILTAIINFFTISSFSQEVKTQLPELNTLIGNWKVISEKRLSANGPWDTSTGRSSFILSAAATLIEEDYKGTLEGKRLLIRSLIAYDHFKQKFQKVFLDSEHGTLIDYDGYKNKDSLVFDKTWVYPAGNTVKLRKLYRFISKDEFTVEDLRMPEGTTSWDLSGKMKYKRVNDSVPSMLKGNFSDDYGIKYTISDTLWLQQPNARYHIIKWDTINQFILARNDDKNPSEAGLYTRIDYMNFSNMEPYLWGFCLTVYDAKTLEEAETKAKADRANPRKGCGGFPFSRMKRE
ncbi:MAG TPA: DUF1579 family protein [Chitinophagaceae bacterium]|nr:DUF1579 family protein [Chitinophagaceae bacterium]